MRKTKAAIWCDEIRKTIKDKNPDDAIRMAQLRIKSTSSATSRREIAKERKA